VLHWLFDTDKRINGLINGTRMKGNMFVALLMSELSEYPVLKDGSTAFFSYNLFAL